MQSNSQSAEQPSRILHTMIRVNDLERSVFFYRDALSMIEMRREDYPEGQFTLSFLGYGNETQGAVLELTYNYGESEYAAEQALVTSLSQWPTSMPPASG
jgi:lactoylglutathione lyase